MPRDSDSEESNSSNSDCAATVARSKFDLERDKDGKQPVLIGPALPPHLAKTLSPQEPLNEDSHKVIGPKLPFNLANSAATQEVVRIDTFGPELPPHLLKKSSGDESKITIGPSLPPHLKKQLEDQANSDDVNDPDNDCFGPLPPGAGQSAAHVALEERALQMRIEKLEPDKNEPVRESWMTELPEAKAAEFGLGPRQFRKQAGPDMSDRSAWTDIAGEKGKRKEIKVDLKAEAERKELEKRDEEYDRVSKKHKRKTKSLVDIHQEKIKKTTEESTERRPFNRDTDLQVNKFDEAQKKAILKKAQLLDDRFSSGKSKYL